MAIMWCVHWGTQILYFIGGGGGADPDDIFVSFMLDFKNYFMKIMSKSPVDILLQYRKNEKLNEKMEIYIFLKFYCFLKPQPISVDDLCCKTVHSTVYKRSVFLKFRIGGCSLPPP
jgi:hypothetical protein